MKIQIISLFLVACGSADPRDLAPAPTVASDPTIQVCDMNCKTGGLNGWWVVPASCDPAAQANPSAPDWFMNCDGVAYQPYTGGAWACQVPQNACVTPCYPAKQACP